MKVPANILDRGFSLHKEEYLKKATDVLESGWYILGPEVERFETSFAQYHNANYAVGVASGLDALIIAFRLLGIKEGDEVICPANTYIASVMGFTKHGAIPVFVEPDTSYNLDPTKIEEAISDKTVAICVVHLYGQIANMPAIMEIAKKHNLKVVEDCAQSHGASIQGKKCGTFGDLGCFSFYPTKNLGAFGDAGALIMNDQSYAEDAKMLRNYGSRVHYEFETVGYNSRLDELQAGLLSVRLQYLDETIEHRHHLATKYLQGITNPKVHLPQLYFGMEGHVFHQFVVEVEDRPAFIDFLKQNGIGTMIHYPEPPHLSQAYQYLGYKEGDFPITERMAHQVVSLPNFEGITDEELDYVIETINAF